MPHGLKPSRDQANKYNKHFVSIASSIIDENQLINPDLSHVENFVNTRKPSTSNFEIPLLDTTTLDKLIKSLPTNVATGLDGISAPLLKLISPAILESLTKVLNCSIQSGICPSALKLARVTPVHKSGSASDPNNFRPISVLPIISKLLERHICTQLMLYLRSFNLIVSTQSGFRPHHSTESILIKMTDDWLEAMDQGLYTGAIYLDLRKAFDVVNHDLLIAKLRIYGCSPSSLIWFKSYLTDRRQCVNLAGTVSDTEVLSSGIPQGSILGPVFFLLFINDLPLSWKSKNGLFADDATFYVSATTLTDVQLQLQQDLNSTATWTKEHGMVAHPDKTKYMIIGTGQKLSRCDDCTLTLFLDERKLEQTQEERLLGLDIDPTLSWSNHVTNLRKKLLKRVAVLARIKKFLPTKYRIILFNASIKPILEYCVSVWASCNVGLLDEIFKVQKRCARLILDAPFQARTLPLFYKLRWLPINHICIKRRLILFKKILEGRAPDYLYKLISLKYCKSYDTRSRMPYRLPIPRTNSRKRMFFYNALQLWKNISDNDFVYSTDLKKFSKNYFDHIMREFTPDSFKIKSSEG